MTCNDFRALTSKCGSEGDLTNAEMAAGLKHLRSCSECNAWVNRLTAGVPVTTDFVRWAEGRCERLEDDPEARPLLTGEGGDE
jgi:predicted anti-sigma-YlaC factor YlaD